MTDPTANTAQRVAVADKVVAWMNEATAWRGTQAPTYPGTYALVLADDYAALLLQVAEQAAEIERLRESVRAYEMFEQLVIGEGAWERFNELRNRTEAAERAREEACGLLRRVHGSLYLLDLPHREFGGVTDKTASDLAAFLAANGGSNG